MLLSALTLKSNPREKSFLSHELPQSHLRFEVAILWQAERVGKSGLDHGVVLGVPIGVVIADADADADDDADGEPMADGTAVGV